MVASCTFFSVFFFFMHTAQMIKTRMKRTTAMATAAIRMGIQSSPTAFTAQLSTHWAGTLICWPVRSSSWSFPSASSWVKAWKGGNFWVVVKVKSWGSKC